MHERTGKQLAYRIHCKKEPGLVSDAEYIMLQVGILCRQ